MSAAVVTEELPRIFASLHIVLLVRHFLVPPDLGPHTHAIQRVYVYIYICVYAYACLVT